MGGSIWANAVEPGVARDEVAARIANDRHAQLANLIQDVGTKTTGIRQLRPWVVYPLVDGAAQVFQKRAKKVALERSDRALCINKYARRSS